MFQRWGGNSKVDVHQTIMPIGPATGWVLSVYVWQFVLDKEHLIWTWMEKCWQDILALFVRSARPVCVFIFLILFHFLHSTAFRLNAWDVLGVHVSYRLWLSRCRSTDEQETNRQLRVWEPAGSFHSVRTLFLSNNFRIEVA